MFLKLIDGLRRPVLECSCAPEALVRVYEQDLMKKLDNTISRSFREKPVDVT